MLLNYLNPQLEDKTLITQEELKDYLHYNPETGIFIRRIKTSNANIGDIVGSTDVHGYKQAGIKGNMYKLHRMAFLYMGKPMPEQVDHINHQKTDNRWCNLRSATAQINQRNKTIQKNNTSGFNGVWWHKQRSKWVAEIKINRKKNYLGIFKDKQDAINARQEANIRYGFHENHGKSLRKYGFIEINQPFQPELYKK